MSIDLCTFQQITIMLWVIVDVHHHQIFVFFYGYADSNHNLTLKSNIFVDDQYVHIELLKVKEKKAEK